MLPNASVLRKISRSKNPLRSSVAVAPAMYASTSRTRVSAPPSRIAVGMRRAPGTNRLRIRSQSRFCPAGPEMTSYSAATTASIDRTSSARTAGGLGCCARTRADTAAARTIAITDLCMALDSSDGRRLARRVEERSLDDRRGDAVAHGLDRYLEFEL